MDSGFLVAPVGDDHDQSSGHGFGVSSGPDIKPDEEPTKDEKLPFGETDKSKPVEEEPAAALHWSKGTRVRVEKRGDAYDPYTKDYCTIAAHTRGKIVRVLNPHAIPDNMVPIKIEGPIDNGVGRIVAIEASNLKGTGIFAAH